jgi:hypothetical protein
VTRDHDANVAVDIYVHAFCDSYSMVLAEFGRNMSQQRNRYLRVSGFCWVVYPDFQSFHPSWPGEGVSFLAEPVASAASGLSERRTSNIEQRTVDRMDDATGTSL